MKRARIFFLSSISVLLILTTIFVIKKVITNEPNNYKNLANVDNSNDEKIGGEIIKEMDDKLFSNYYDKAKKLTNSLSLDEKINQLLLVRFQDNANKVLDKYQLSGFVFFAKDFENKTEEEVKTMIKELQAKSKIPLLIAVDEEGGEVNRVSLNKNLVKTPFKSSQVLYKKGGLDLIKEDTINKSKILASLGINLNLAPVVDISENPNDYMYKRTIGQNYKITAEYAKTVIEASKKSSVSYTLKHFPGYGKNVDTHTSSSIDNRELKDLQQKDLIPFQKGIEKGAEAVLISHNILNKIDDKNPASLSSKIHDILRNDLKFTGIIITDALDMDALNNIDNIYIKAINAGNNILITTDYKTSFNEIKQAINNNLITADKITNLATEVIAWKYYKRLIIDN